MINAANQQLTNDQIMRVAPSAFAVTPWYKQSSKYAFVPTSCVIEGMRQAGFVPVKASQSRTRIQGKELFTKHMIRFRQANVTLTAVGQRALETVLVNSHDGTSAYELSMGVFELACMNGLMVSKELVDAIHIRHTGNIIDMVVDGSTRLLTNGPRITDAIQTWQHIQLTQPEQRILAEEAHSLRFDEDAVAPPAENLLRARRYDDAGADLWSTFNRIQENAIKGGLRTFDAETRRRNRTREVKGIDQNVKLNRALWSLAEKMAELKGGHAS